MDSAIQSNKVTELLEPREGWISSWLPWLRWTPTSAKEVRDAEEALLVKADLQSEGFYVSAGEVGGQECRIWTRKFGEETPGKVPLVLVHGMGAGLALFVLNLGPLSSKRLVYAIDLPGFGRSSRVNFSSNPDEVESDYVECLETWRKNVGLGKINMLGHSFGGYLTALYSLKYPGNLNSAVLADPWGMAARPEDTEQRNGGQQQPPRRQIPAWVRTVARLLRHFNPLWGLRAAGPWGPWVVRRMRPDIMRKYEDLVGPDSSLVSDYIFHCNGHSPTGETAFHRLMSGFGWANNPVMPRLQDLRSDGQFKLNGKLLQLSFPFHFSVRMKVLYGSQSFITHLTEEDFVSAGVKANIKVDFIDNAGHHIYSDQYEHFNNTVNNFCSQAD